MGPCTCPSNLKCYKGVLPELSHIYRAGVFNTTSRSQDHDLGADFGSEKGKQNPHSKGREGLRSPRFPGSSSRLRQPARLFDDDVSQHLLSWLCLFLNFLKKDIMMNAFWLFPLSNVLLCSLCIVLWNQSTFIFTAVSISIVRIFTVWWSTFWFMAFGLCHFFSYRKHSFTSLHFSCIPRNH